LFNEDLVNVLFVDEARVSWFELKTHQLPRIAPAAVPTSRTEGHHFKTAACQPSQSNGISAHKIPDEPQAISKKAKSVGLRDHYIRVFSWLEVETDF
jgi:hypothetical protein